MYFVAKKVFMKQTLEWQIASVKDIKSETANVKSFTRPFSSIIVAFKPSMYSKR